MAWKNVLGSDKNLYDHALELLREILRKISRASLKTRQLNSGFLRIFITISKEQYFLYIEHTYAMLNIDYVIIL